MSDHSEISDGDTFLAGGPAARTGQDEAIEALRRAVLAPVRELEAGDVLADRYVLGEVLGRGGMGVVWRARDERLDRDVAVKLLEGHVTTERLARMRREAQAVAQLAHPNVVPVYDVGQHGARPYLVMELVRGQELGAWLAGEPRPRWRAVLAAFVAAGKGLVAAHDAGLVHRDFKPANVLMGEDGRPRVVDFGLVCSRDDRASEADSAPVVSHASLTLTGVVLGTPSYMAPEQHEGKDATAASDVFGFAVSLYEGLYGERPYRGDSVVALLEAKRGGPPQTAPSSDVPHAVFEAVVGGLAADPSRRWPSMLAFVAELERAARPRTTIAIGVAAVVLTSLGFLGWGGSVREANACDHRIEEFAGDFELRRTALGKQLDEAGVSTSTKGAVRQVLGAYAVHWTEAARASCDPARTSSAVPASRIEECLFRSQTAMFRLLDEATDDAEAARAFDRRLRTLPDASDCTDRLLAHRQPLPDRPEVRRQVETLADWVAQSRTNDEAIAVLDEVPERMSQARALGHLPTAAAIALEASHWSTNNGNLERGKAYCTEAYELAVEGGADRLAMRAAHECLTATAWIGDVEAARRWDREARALHTRVGAAPHVRVGARADLAMALRIANETDEARAHSAEVFEEAMALPWHDRHSIHAFVTLGTVSIWLGDLEQARARFEASIAKAHEYYPGNDDAVVPAEAQLGTVYRYLDQPEQAEQMYRRVLARDIPAALRQQTQANLALLLAEDPARGEEARSLVARLKRELEGTDKEDGYEMGNALAATGHVERKLGDAEAARAAYRSALRIFERCLEPGHVRIVDVEGMLAELPEPGAAP